MKSRGRWWARRPGCRQRQVAILLFLVALAAPLQASSAQWRWRKVPVPGGEGPLHAVALDLPTRRVAVADARGALLGLWPLSSGDPEGWRRVARVEAITDLHFDDGGALWIASLSGLWRLGSGGRLEERSPGAGDDARRVLRFASQGGLRVAAGAGGAFISEPGSGWRRLTQGLPVGSFQGAALGRLEGKESRPGWALWLLAGRDLWRVEVFDYPDGPRAGSARRVRVPGRPLEAVPVDVALGVAGSEVVVLYPRALARTLPGPVEGRRWEIDFPVWPAGASARRITAGSARRLWLTTDGGLLGASALPGPWAGAASPLGSMPVAQAVSAQGGSVLAAGRGGLFHGQLRATAELTKGGSISLNWPAEEPTLGQVQARALGYAGLGPDYFRRLRSGLSRRGWWPAVALRAGSRFGRDEESSRDQTFTYGELHDLHDASLDQSRDFDASITFAWELGELVYPSDAPELSREARQVIGLRDNVLDEVNQLYFDRPERTQRLTRAFSRGSCFGPLFGPHRRLKTVIRSVPKRHRPSPASP